MMHTYTVKAGINQRMEDLYMEYDVDFAIFGDSAYSGDTHCSSYLGGADPTGRYRRFNGAMKSVRVMIEWSYMVTAN